MKRKSVLTFISHASLLTELCVSKRNGSESWCWQLCARVVSTGLP